ncbi:MAG: cytochrome-c peroxidase [Variibacter sp.]
MNLGTCRALASVLLMACSVAAVAGATHRVAWRAEYRRPAVPVSYPKENPYTPAKAHLGKLLFFDPILSGSRSRSCATCHNPSLSWTDSLPRALSDTQTPMPLRSPTLLNVGTVPILGWDGKFPSLEAVTFGPITAANNMNLSEADLVKRLAAIPGYVEAFRAAFGEDAISRRNIERAVATYERSIVSAPAPFDRWIDGDKKAISEQAKRGFDVFNGKANCAACHSGWAFTDGSFHDIGSSTGDDIGRGQFFPTSKKLKYAFKTPTLRDVARRSPYMHDGSVTTLAEVIELYNRGGIDRPSRSNEIKPLGLTEREKADLIAFLETLTGDMKPEAVPVLPR